MGLIPSCERMETVIDRNLIESQDRVGALSRSPADPLHRAAWLSCDAPCDDALGVGSTAAYRRVAACIDRGLLERLDLLTDRAEPAARHPRRPPLRRPRPAPRNVSPGAVDHWLRCATTAQLLGERYGHDRILTERELVLAEQIEERLIAIRQGRRASQRSTSPSLSRPGHPHRGRPVAIEVELTPKAPQRLRAI